MLRVITMTRTRAKVAKAKGQKVDFAWGPFRVSSLEYGTILYQFWIYQVPWYRLEHSGGRKPKIKESLGEAEDVADRCCFCRTRYD